MNTLYISVNKHVISCFPVQTILLLYLCVYTHTHTPAPRVSRPPSSLLTQLPELILLICTTSLANATRRTIGGISGGSEVST